MPCRGCATPIVRATGYGLSETVEEYLRLCREELLVLVQVESSAGVEAIPEIAEVDGVDGIFLGPYDLGSNSMAFPRLEKILRNNAIVILVLLLYNPWF